MYLNQVLKAQIILPKFIEIFKGTTKFEVRTKLLFDNILRLLIILKALTIFLNLKEETSETVLFV
jgi:hypothetical protein